MAKWPSGPHRPEPVVLHIIPFGGLAYGGYAVKLAILRQLASLRTIQVSQHVFGTTGAFDKAQRSSNRSSNVDAWKNWSV